MMIATDDALKAVFAAREEFDKELDRYMFAVAVFATGSPDALTERQLNGERDAFHQAYAHYNRALWYATTVALKKRSAARVASQSDG